MALRPAGREAMLAAMVRPPEVAMHLGEYLLFLAMMLPTFLLLGVAALGLAGF